MKIIFYRGDYPKQFNTETFKSDPVGGTEFAAGYLAKELAKKHNVYFICQTPKQAKIDKIHWVPIKKPKSSNLKNAFREVGPADLLILVGGLSNPLDALQPKVKKTILWANGVSLKPNTIKHLLENKIDQVVCMTKYARDAVLDNTIKRLPPKPKIKHFFSKKLQSDLKSKFSFIYNGVNLKLFEKYGQIAKKSFKILYVGVFNQQKNPDKILAAFPEIKKRLPHAELYMCGSIKQYKKEGGDKTTGYFDGDDFFERIKTYIYNKEGGMRPGVYLRGGLAPERLAYEMISASLVVVNPKVGNQESSCIGALEAQAAGTAVLGGGASALCETIQHKKTGIVFKKQENLAPWAVKMLQNPKKIKKMGQRGRKRALAGFSWQTLAHEWEELIKAVLDNKGYAPREH